MYVSVVPAKRQLSFHPTDFLVEAIEDFLESGAKPLKMGRCIIMIAIATELLLKDKLEKICPALVLENIDDGGLQLAKLYGLGKKMLASKELDEVELRTASFPKLLTRVGKFFDIREARSHLSKLHHIRNELIHHRGTVDLAAVNLLLIDNIFPFLEQFTKDDTSLKFRLTRESWERLRQLADSSADIVAMELAKKLAHFGGIANRMSENQTQALLNAKAQSEKDEDIIEDGLLCPACKNRSLTALSGVDIDFDDGQPVGGSVYFVMRCKVCGLELEEDEIGRIIGQFERFLGKDQKKEAELWDQATSPPDFSEVYPY